MQILHNIDFIDCIGHKKYVKINNEINLKIFKSLKNSLI